MREAGYSDNQIANISRNGTAMLWTFGLMAVSNALFLLVKQFIAVHKQKLEQENKINVSPEEAESWLWNETSYPWLLGEVFYVLTRMSWEQAAWNTLVPQIATKEVGTWANLVPPGLSALGQSILKAIKATDAIRNTYLRRDEIKEPEEIQFVQQGEALAKEEDISTEDAINEVKTELNKKYRQRLKDAGLSMKDKDRLPEVNLLSYPSIKAWLKSLPTPLRMVFNLNDPYQNFLNMKYYQTGNKNTPLFADKAMQEAFELVGFDKVAKDIAARYNSIKVQDADSLIKQAEDEWEKLENVKVN